MTRISTLLETGLLSIRNRQKLFLLLAAFAGLLSIIAVAPALDSIAKASNLIAAAAPDGSETAALSEQITAFLPSLFMGFMASLLIQGMLSPLWARAANPVQLIPWDGQIGSLIALGAKCFVYLLTATLFSLVLFAFLLSILGKLGTVGILVASILSIWNALFLSSSANTAIIIASTGQPIKFTAAMARARPFQRQLVSTLALISVGVFVISLFLQNILFAGLSEAIALRVQAFLHGALGYISAAYHISILYCIPGLLDRKEND